MLRTAGMSTLVHAKDGEVSGIIEVNFIACFYGLNGSKKLCYVSKLKMILRTLIRVNFLE